VLEGLRGRGIAELCNAHQISQAQYYQWRDQFLGNAARAFEAGQQTAKESRLLRENARLKGLVGELTLELIKATRAFMKRQSKAWHWLLALNKAVNQHFPNEARNQGLHLMSENGCQPTSVSFMETCSVLGVKQTFTSYNSPKGNAGCTVL
jgi:transposase-like protein